MILKNKRTVICACCGTAFDTNKSSSKYCSEYCRNYVIRKRQSAYKKAKKEKYKTELKELTEEAKDIDAILSSQKAPGDSVQKTEFNHNKYGNSTSPEYWRDYKATVLSFVFDKSKSKLEAYVNEISVYELEFEKLVVESIKELNKIVIISKLVPIDLK